MHENFNPSESTLIINIDIAKTEYDNKMQDINFKYRNQPRKTIKNNITIIIIIIIIRRRRRRRRRRRIRIKIINKKSNQQKALFQQPQSFIEYMQF